MPVLLLAPDLKVQVIFFFFLLFLNLGWKDVQIFYIHPCQLNGLNINCLHNFQLLLICALKKFLFPSQQSNMFCACTSLALAVYSSVCFLKKKELNANGNCLDGYIQNYVISSCLYLLLIQSIFTPKLCSLL